MKPLPALILVLAAFGMHSGAVGINEAYRFEFGLIVIAGAGMLGILRGLDVPLGGILWDAYGERRHWITVAGATVILLCVGLANWHLTELSGA